MSNLLKEFLTQGIADQVVIMGQDCVLCDTLKGTTTPSFQAVVTSRDGQTEVEVGGITYSVTGHALIPATNGITPKIGNRLETEGETWLLVSAVKSSNDAAFSCDMVRVK